MPAKAILLTLLFFPAVVIPSLSQTAPDTKNEIETHSRLAQQYLGERRPDLAIPELEKVVALDPKNADAQGNLGVLLFFRGDYKGAAPHLHAAIEMKPYLWKIQGLLGLAEAQMGDQTASRTELEAAFPHLTEKTFQLDVGKALIDNYTRAAIWTRQRLRFRPCWSHGPPTCLCSICRIGSTPILPAAQY